MDAYPWPVIFAVLLLVAVVLLGLLVWLWSSNRRFQPKVDAPRSSNLPVATISQPQDIEVFALFQLFDEGKTHAYFHLNHAGRLYVATASQGISGYDYLLRLNPGLNIAVKIKVNTVSLNPQNTHIPVLSIVQM